MALITRSRSQMVDEKDSSSKVTLGGLFRTAMPIFNTRKIREPFDESADRLEIEVTPANEFQDISQQKIEPYPMYSRHRGVLLLINNVQFEGGFKRRGADIDENNLKELFHQLHFTVHVYNDLSLTDFKELIMFFVGDENEQLSKYDCCFVIVNSIGVSSEGKMGQETHIQMSDNKTIGSDWLIEMIGDRKCKALAGKPKVILFNLSRGKCVDKGVRLTKSACAKDGPIMHDTKNGNQTDMLIGYSTLAGYASFRNTVTGSWYINCLCKIFAENAHDTDVEKMLEVVSFEVNGMHTSLGEMQTPVLENRCFRPCYLYPNLYLEDGKVAKRISDDF